MQGVGAAPRHDLYLAPGATAEVRSLVRCSNLELLNTFDRDRNNSRGCLVVAGTMIVACSSRGVRAETPNVSVVVSAHVVGGKAAVQLEGVLVRSVAADVAIDVLAGLKDGEGRGVAAGIRQVDKSLAAQVRTHSGVHSLQLGAGCIGNLDGLRNRADLKDRVYG